MLRNGGTEMATLPRRIAGITIVFLCGAGLFVLSSSRHNVVETESSLRGFGPYQTAASPPVLWYEYSQCYGPGKGYIHGGDTSQVLEYTRLTRDAADRSLVDVVEHLWDLKYAEGLFNFPVRRLPMRHAAGGELGWDCEVVANTGRNKPFPPPGPASTTWDPAKFNFYKGQATDFMFSYQPHFLQPGGGGGGDDGAGGDGGGGRGGGHAGVRVERSAAASGPGALCCREVSTGAVEPENAVLINVNPLSPRSFLLVPRYPDSMPQRATAETLAVALDFAEGLRASPGLRLAFNGHGASASVNHLHFQGWYFDGSPDGRLPIERAESEPLGWLREDLGDGAVEVRRLARYPIQTLAYGVEGKDPRTTGAAIALCVDYLVSQDIPHNMLFSEGKAFLMPRRPMQQPPFASVPGYPEMSGEVILTEEAAYPTLRADDVYAAWRDLVSLDAHAFQQVVDHCTGPLAQGVAAAAAAAAAATSSADAGADGARAGDHPHV